MLKIKVIGCASGRPDPNIAGSAYLLMQNDRRILFDAGEGVSSALLRTGIDPLSLDTIFISHTHSDHISGLFLYLQMVHGMRRTDPLDICMPSEAIDPFITWLNAAYLFPERLSMPVEFHPVDSDFEFEMTDLRVSPHPTSHIGSKRDFVREHNLPNKFQCFAYIIEAAGRKIIYSADLGHLNDIAGILVGSDLAVVEGFHVDLEQLSQLAIDKGVKRIMLTHLPEDFDIAAATSQFAAQGFRELIFAEEGLEIAFD